MTKYIKLFEHWLNEAESKVKPFDPNNPGETLVVDITGKDMSNEPEQVSKVLGSVLNRMIAKEDSPNAKDTIKLIPFFVGDMSEGKFTLESGGKEYTLSYPKKDDVGILRKCHNDNFPIFLVTPSNFELGEKIPQVNYGENKMIWLVPSAGTDSSIRKFGGNNFFGDSGPKGFRVAVSSISQGLPMKQFTLNNIISIFSSYGESSLNSNAPHEYKDIANALGYEIPDNYTPKQGGIKKETKVS